MKLKQLLLIVLMFTCGLASAQQMGPIPVNKNVRQGKLSNGLTYYILKNNWPENVANFYIAQRVGSIQEEENQRGLAHFLEHMAFNGSEHFPDSTLLEFTRSLGVEFGSDLNAYTSIDQTVYRVCNVPTARQTALDSCLLILKDWSNGLTLADKEIDKERGVIHQEWQMGQNAMMRIYDRSLPKFYPGSRYGHRLPIGLMSVVDNFKYQALRDYYHRWYHPSNQCIIVVGDIDIDHTEKEIQKLWANAVTPKDAPAVVDELVPDNKEAIYIFDKDKEMQRTSIGIAMKHDVFPKEMKGDVAYLLDSYFKQMIAMMLNQRLSEMSQKADCPFTAASGYDGNYMISDTKDAFQLSAMPKEGKDLDALKAIYREAQRVRKFGFTPGEFDRMKSEYLSQLESQYENRNKIRNDQYGDELRDHFLENEPIPSKEEEYQIMKQLIEIPQLGVEIVNQYATELITDTDSNLVVYIFGRDKEGVADVTEAQMAQAIQSVRAEDIQAYVDNTKNEPLLDEKKLPKAGKIVKETINKQFDYKELTLSNGARVILKKTDFKDNEVQFQAMAEGGSGSYGKADYDNIKLFDAIVATSGLGNFSNQELKKALFGKQASIQVGLGNYYQYLSGYAVPKDIETMLQLLYLNFTSVKKDQQAYDALMTQLEQGLKNKHLSPESVFGDSIKTTMYKGNLREAPFNVENLKNINYDRVLQIWKERFASPGQFVYYFVGNFDEATLRPLIEKYIASLPKGKAQKYVDVPGIVSGKNINHYKFKAETPKAIAFDVWHKQVPYTVENKVLADAAGQVLSMVYLKSIREDEGAAYSVSAGGDLRRQGKKYQVVLQAYCPMDPTKAELAVKLLNDGLKENTIKVDEDKVQKVKDFMLKQADLNAKNNGHWMDIIDEYVWTGVDFQTGYKAAVEALTPAKIAAYLKSLLEAGNQVEVVMTPAE
ncbi:MAG: insulinase family protein [Prevotella sp.]|nr:insulinase family protein [Prevotella sp.]MDD7273340.1 insulinase family protein [Prevotellaceae bacterium]MDY3936169.1 insulinase family protein [Prevotella sp.]MDY4218152.1 insulinase family protein [Prevotella sp.]